MFRRDFANRRGHDLKNHVSPVQVRPSAQTLLLGFPKIGLSSADSESTGIALIPASQARETCNDVREPFVDAGRRIRFGRLTWTAPTIDPKNRAVRFSALDTPSSICSSRSVLGTLQTAALSCRGRCKPQGVTVPG